METKKNNKSLGGTVKKQVKTKQDKTKQHKTKQQAKAGKATTKQAKAVKATRAKAFKKGGGDPLSNEEWIAKTNHYCDEFKEYYNTTNLCSMKSIDERAECVRNVVKRENWSNTECSTNILDILKILKTQEEENKKTTQFVPSLSNAYTQLKNMIIRELKEYSLLSEVEKEQQMVNSNGKRNLEVNGGKTINKTKVKRGGGEDEDLHECLFDISIASEFHKGYQPERSIKNIKLCAREKYGPVDHVLIRLWNDKVNSELKRVKDSNDIIGMYISKLEGDMQLWKMRNNTAQINCHQHNINILIGMKRIDNNEKITKNAAYEGVKSKILSSFERNFDVSGQIQSYVKNLLIDHRRKEEQTQLNTLHNKRSTNIFSKFNAYEQAKNAYYADIKTEPLTEKSPILYNTFEAKRTAFLSSFERYFMHGKGASFLRKISQLNYDYRLGVNRGIVIKYTEVANAAYGYDKDKYPDYKMMNLTNNPPTLYYRFTLVA